MMTKKKRIYYTIPGSIPSVLGESGGAKMVTNRITTLLSSRRNSSDQINYVATPKILIQFAPG